MLQELFSGITPAYMGIVVAGVVWGLIFGAIPGLTATLAIVVLIPITYGMTATNGMALLIGIYVGAISGGLVSAILLGMPGTPSSITTAFDGFPLAKRGKARKALGAGITANFMGTMFGWIFLVTMAMPISRFAMNFTSWEYVAIITFGLTAVVSLSGNSLVKGISMTAFGLLIATIGTDPTYGMYRNTFGIKILRGGVAQIPAMIGLFVISQIFVEVKNMGARYLTPKAEKINPFLTRTEWAENGINFIRSGMIGLMIGILPGIGGALSNFVAYDQAKRASKHPEKFGDGSLEGIIASETANNASIGGALIPMLAMGIPGDASTAALLGGLMLHGLQTGPLLMKEHGEIAYGIFGAVFLATVAMAVIMMGGIRIFPVLLRIPKSFLLPLVLMIGMVGCYNLQYSMSDVWIAMIFGILGFVLKKYDYPLTPVVISLVLGKNLETSLRRGMQLSDGSLLPLLTRPIPCVFMILTCVSLGFSIGKKRRERKKINT